ncbi:tripartite tricarboxylate transporter substrate binding protein [Pigmentiphaga soli]|uniref:Bug family tripartite tricarboxylate transporter substrate binding protein n=1 Tax=Pigmentiphaga soli TaxID=1007095 RepID=UPI0031EACB88
MPCSLFVALASSLACPAHAQEPFPSKPITLIVPYTAGGPTDVMGRLAAKAIKDRLNQPVIVENVPGAASNVGAARVARSAPDGYTLLLGTSVTFAINPNLYKSLPYDARTDFAPVTAIALTPSVLLINASLPFNDVGDLIDFARRNPGKLRYASYGYGSVGHLNGAQLAARAGIDLQHIPYKGSAEAIRDLMGGYVDLAFDPVMTAVSNMKSSKLRALGITSAERSPALPRLATIAEQGLPGFEYAGWYGIVAPAGTPPAVLDKLNAALVAGLQDPEIARTLIASGTSPAPMSQQEFASLIRSTYDKSKRLIAEYGLTPN